MPPIDYSYRYVPLPLHYASDMKCHFLIAYETLYALFILFPAPPSSGSGWEVCGVFWEWGEQVVDCGQGDDKQHVP